MMEMQLPSPRGGAVSRLYTPPCSACNLAEGRSGVTRQRKDNVARGSGKGGAQQPECAGDHEGEADGESPEQQLVAPERASQCGIGGLGRVQPVPAPFEAAARGNDCRHQNNQREIGQQGTTLGL